VVYDNRKDTDYAFETIYEVRPSFLAAASPDEDFIERYKLAVLSRAGLTSLVFEIPRTSKTFNVLRTAVSNETQRTEAACLAAYIPGTPIPR
jgi:hypothetical protein